jgi:hypothetical protein
MKKRLYPLLFLLFFIQGIPCANASQIMGSDLTWTCIGQDSFLIKLVVYGDCNGYAVVSGSIKFNCATSGALITSITANPGTPVDITPVCSSSCSRCTNPSCSFPYGINRYVMQGIVCLNSAGTCCNIDISWTQCCRNLSITTVTLYTQYYTEAKLNRCLNPCDNSPTFSNAPVAILCVGQPFTFNHGVQDIDKDSTGGLADSLTYQWYVPLSAANSSVGYIPPYTYDKPIFFYGFPNDALPWPRGIHLNPESGEIQFQPMKPEVTIMIVKVNEFRNGVKIAELRREMQIIVITCLNNNPPSITTPNNVRSKSVCAGDTVTFDFSTSDPNASDTVAISWNKAIPGAVWTHTNGQSKYPTARLTWKTTNADGNALPYTFTVKAKDNACPVNASFIQAYQINVKLRLKGKISVSDLGCGLYHFGLDTAYKQNLNFVINTEGKKVALDNTHNYKFDTAGVYPYILTVSYPNNCNTISDTGIIKVAPFLYLRLPADTAICPGSSINIEPKVFLNKGPVKYLWGTGDTNRILHTALIKNNTTISLTVKDSVGCTTTKSIKITMLKSPDMIPDDAAVCFGSTFSIEPMTSFAKGHVTYYWSNGDTNRILLTGRIKNIETINLTVKDSTECLAMDSIKISIQQSPEMIPADTVICYGSKLSLEPKTSFAKGHISYKWSTGDTNRFLHLGRVYTTSRYFMLTIEDSTGCTVDNSILINTLKYYSMMPNDTAICYGSIFSIEPGTSFTKGHVTYNWSTGDTNRILHTSRIYKDSLITLNIEDSAGCAVQDYINISMLLNPEIAMDDTIGHCKNRSVLIAPNYQVFGTFNYISDFKWHISGNYSTISNQLKLFIPDSGIYVFSIVDKFGCSDSDSVRVNTFPPIDTSLRVNAYVLTASAGMKNYRWYRNDTLISTADSNIFTAPSNGGYYVLLTDSNDCIDRSRTVIINLIGINQRHSMGSVKLYPNPTTGKLMLETDEPITGEISLIITNMYGREIINRTVKSNDIQTVKEIDISDQPAGIYTIFIRYQKNSYHQIIIKE